jgi:hypothetical protein
MAIASGPEDACRLASGEQLSCTWGKLVRLAPALDFLVVADHGVRSSQ